MGKIKNYIKTHLIAFNILRTIIGLIVIYYLFSLKNVKEIGSGESNFFTFPIFLIFIWKITTFPFLNQKKMFAKFSISIIFALLYTASLFLFCILAIAYLSELFFFIPIILSPFLDYFTNFYLPTVKRSIYYTFIFIGIGIICLLFSNKMFILYNHNYETKSYMENITESFFMAFFIIQAITLNIFYYYQFIVIQKNKGT